MSSVAVHDTLDCCKPDTRPRKFRGGVEALKRAEELTSVFRIESGAVVADVERRHAVLVAALAHVDGRDADAGS